MKLYLEPEALMRVAMANRERYQDAEPFPHVVLDDVLPAEMLDQVLDGFPDPRSKVWKEYDNPLEKKLETQGEDRLGADLSLLLYQFNSAPFLRFLELLTGIDDLLGDPYFSGGGLHQIERGGKLGIHADFSRHHALPIERRLNVLIFLNRDWPDEFGGHLELWDKDMTHCVQRIAPVFNRMVVFTTTDWALHGHPDPLTCPPDRTRKSIALYYFTVDRPAGETRPDKESTLFSVRPGEVFPEGTRLDRGADYAGLATDHFDQPTQRRRVARALRRVTPPILYDAVLASRRKSS